MKKSDRTATRVPGILQRWTVRRFVIVTLLLGGVFSGFVPTAHADVTAAWHLDADGNWSEGANWQGGNAPTGTTGVASFTNAITADRTVTVDASPWTINGLNFGNTGAYGFRLTGGTINLGGTTPTITVHPGSTGLVSSVLAGTTAPHLAGLTKAGAGTLTLDGVNTYSGGTMIRAGTLNIAPGGALNGTSIINPVSGGTLTLSGTVNITNGIFAAGSGTADTGTMNIEPGAVVNVVNGANASRVYIGGKIDNTGSAGLGILNLNGGVLNIPAGGQGAAGDAWCFWLNPYASGGASTLNLNGGVLNTARPIADGGSGKSILNFNGGVLRAATNMNIIGSALGIRNVRNGGAIFDTQGYSVTQAHAMKHSDIGGDHAIDGGLTKLGAGVLTLTGANTYTGPTAISNGVLSALTTSALPGYATSGQVTLAPGAGLSVGVGSWTTAAINALLATGVYGADTLFGFDTTAGNYTYTGQFDLPAVAGLVKTGPNVLTLPNSTSVTGPVTVYGGILQADFGAGLPAATNVTLTGASLSAASGTLTASLGSGAGQITFRPDTDFGFSAVDTPLTVNLGGAGGILSWGSPLFNPGTLVLNDTGANTNLTFLHGLALNADRTIKVNASEAEIRGVLSDGSAAKAALVKEGAGTLTLSSANTYSGNTTINGGTLKLTGGNDPLNTAGAITLNANTTLDLGGNTQTMTSGDFSMDNTTTLKNGTVNYRNASWSPTDNASVTFGPGGGFNSPHRLILQRAQILTLASGAGATSFGGDASFSANYIGVDQNNASTVVVNGGSLNFTNMASGAGYLRIGANGSTTVTPRGTLTVNNGAVNVGHSMSMGTRYDMGGAAAYGVATLNLNGGEITIGTGTATAPSCGSYGALSLGNNHSSTMSSSTVNLNGGVLSLCQIDGGAYGNNTVHFNGGVLKARADNTSFVCGKNLACVIGPNNAKIDTDAFTVGFDTSLSGIGSLIKQGTGTLILSGVNTYSGMTTVEAGTLTLAAPSPEAHLKLHLDASEISSLYAHADGTGAITGGGQQVGYWGDLSGNGKPATQETAGRRPIYTNNVPEFNGRAVLQFDGIDDDITSLLDINPANLPNMTIIMVYRQVAKSANGGLWGHDNNGWDRLQLLNFSAGGHPDGYPIASDGGCLPVKGMNTNAVLIRLC